MTWWMWTILGVVVWFIGLVLVVALVRAGAEEDKKTGRS